MQEVEQRRTQLPSGIRATGFSGTGQRQTDVSPAPFTSHNNCIPGPLCNLARLYFQMHSFSFLQITDDTKQITGLWIPLRAEHAHEAFT
jgi:hypothetical protein